KSRSQPPDFAPALKVDAEGPFVARRYKELLATKSFREPARQLCRQFFIETLGPVDWSKDAIDVAQDASFWTRWRTQRRLQRLWSLADGTLSHRISHARFLRIASEISTLRDELKRGVTQLHVRQKSNGPKPTI